MVISAGADGLRADWAASAATSSSTVAAPAAGHVVDQLHGSAGTYQLSPSGKMIMPAPSGGSALSFFTTIPSPTCPDQPEAGIVTVIGVPDRQSWKEPSGRPATADGVADGLGEGVATDGAGVAVGGAVAPGPLETGPSRRAPTTTARTSAATPAPMGMSLFMSGTLHGPMTARCRVVSIRSRT